MLAISFSQPLLLCLARTPYLLPYLLPTAILFPEKKGGRGTERRPSKSFCPPLSFLAFHNFSRVPGVV